MLVDHVDTAGVCGQSPKAEMKTLAWLSCIVEALGNNPFPSSFKLLAESSFGGCRTEVAVSLPVIALRSSSGGTSISEPARGH